MLFLVHHADAVAADVDAQRPLSASGRVHVERLAVESAAKGVKPQAIWHSGKLRARQTAEAFLRTCNPLAEFSAIRGLQPTDPPQMIEDQLRGEIRDVMLVGHMPNVERVHELLLRHAHGLARPTFPLHGIVAIEGDGTSWREVWRME
jgi:phosphohistidine phosphatase